MTTDYKLVWKDIQTNEHVIEYENETKNELRYWHNEIVKFNSAFRNKEGKKDRSDHRHHAIDALITACCSNKIIQTLSTLNAMKEENPDAYEFRDKIERIFDYIELKNSISSILVSHQEKQNLIKKRKNRIKNKQGVSEQITYAPQGSLHKETFYGRLKEPLNQGYNKQNVFISRSRLVSKNGSSESYLIEKESTLENIYEPHFQKILEDRLNLVDLPKDEKGKELKTFSEKALSKLPVKAPSVKNDGISKKGNPTPVIKSIRTKYKNENSLIRLNLKNEMGDVLKESDNRRYADKEGSYMMILYDQKQYDKKGKLKKPVREFILLSFWEAVAKRKVLSKLFIDEYKEIGLYADCQWLKKGDMVLLYENEEEKQTINWDDNYTLSNKIYRINEIGNNPTGDGYASIKLEPHKLMKKTGDKYLAIGKFLKRSESITAIKVRLDCLGNIIAKGEECF